jgi:transcription elongation factor Elf1
MRAGDFTCLLCGSKLQLKISELSIGINSGTCPMCGEPFTLKLNKKDIELLLEAEETARQ